MFHPLSGVHKTLVGKMYERDKKYDPCSEYRYLSFRVFGCGVSQTDELLVRHSERKHETDNKQQK